MQTHFAFVDLRKDKEQGEELEEGQDGYRERNQPKAPGVVCRGGRVRRHDEARLVAADLTVDPGLVSGHSGVDAWETRETAALAKTHHASLDPDCAVFGHQRAARIPLHRWNIRHVSGNQVFFSFFFKMTFSFYSLPSGWSLGGNNIPASLIHL